MMRAPWTQSPVRNPSRPHAQGRPFTPSFPNAIPLNNYEERKRQEALAAAQKTATEFGFKLEDLMGGKLKKPKANGVAKYAHPENPTTTWTGKGRKLAWVNEHLDAGKSLEDLAI